MSEDIVSALKTVYDPEIPADIYELGLIYKVDIKDDRTVDVDMTLTTPNCPAAAGTADDGGECGGQRAGRRPGHLCRWSGIRRGSGAVCRMRRVSILNMW